MTDWMETVRAAKAMMAELSHDEKVATGKRWGEANGYRGARGGWVYRVLPNGKWKPVTQGWWAFCDDMKLRIHADVVAGKFKVSRSREKAS